MSEDQFLDADSDEFGTPDYIYNALNEEFQFTIDVAATAQNTKCAKFFTKEDNGLLQSWANEVVWCNPPYSRGNVKDFATKALVETQQLECLTAVLLVPTKTEQDWFQNFRSYFEVRFIRGRVKFIGGKTSARDTHMLVIYRTWKWNKVWCR